MEAADKKATEAQAQAAPMKAEVQKPVKEEKTLKEEAKEETHKPKEEAGHPLP